MGLPEIIKTSSAKVNARVALPFLALPLERDVVVQVRDIVRTVPLGDTSAVASAQSAPSAGTKQRRMQRHAKLAMLASIRRKSNRPSALYVREASTLLRQHR
jgi:hypothetical protein